MSLFEDTPDDIIPPGSRVALYLRTATTSQGGGATDLDRQRNDLVRYCDEQACEVTVERSDVGSGKSIGPGLKDLAAMAASEQRPFDVVLVDSFSRFSRCAYAFRTILNDLEQDGVKVVSLTEPSRFVALLTLEVLESQSERQSQIARRVGARRKAESAAPRVPVSRRKKHKCPACEGRGWTEIAS